MDSSDSSEDENFDPEEIINVRDFEAEKDMIVKNLLPDKSRANYELAYGHFLKWKTDNKAQIDENSLIVYFKELTSKWKPTNFDLLKSFLKNFCKGYKPKKAPTLNWTQINKFLAASDEIYLALKYL